MKERIEELTAEIEDKTKQVESLLKEIMKCKEERTALLILPYHAGDKVICTLPHNKNTKGEPFSCTIEISGDTVYVAPFKKDGSVSGRHYMVVPEENKTYANYFQKG